MRPDRRLSGRNGMGAGVARPPKRPAILADNAVNLRGIGGSAPKLRRRVATSLHDTSILLELRRWHIAESGVEPFLVVDAFEELTHACASLAEIPIFGAIHLLVFEGLHERLTGSVVVWISLTAHADLRVVLPQHLRIVPGGVLHAEIGVMHQTRLRLSLRQRHPQGR